MKAVALSLLFLPFIITSPCPKKCSCHSSWLRGITSVVVDCSKKGLTEIPTKGLPKYMTSFVLNGNLITEIPKDVFKKYKYLRELYLYKNFIVKIEFGAFDGLRRLSELSLHSNQLKRLENGTFRDLRNLQRLYLFTNLLQEINGRVFEGLNKLRTLYLHENLLRSIPKDTFKSLQQLLILTLHRNYLRVLNTGSFDGIESVSQIFCHQNKISKIEANTFQDCKSLRKLQLGNNHIKALTKEMFQGLSILQELYLDNNHITKINDSDIFTHLSYLHKLVLLGNKIKYLGKGSFKHLYGLSVLSLSGNRLTHLSRGTFSGLSALQTLFLQENKIKRIESLAFEGMRRLSRLYLFRNDIFYVEEKTFFGLSTLSELNLGVNNITALANGAFVGLSRLMSLQLNSNRIKIIPSGVFASLGNLYRLVIYFNKISYIDEGAFAGMKRLQSIIWYPPLSLVKNSKVLGSIRSNQLTCDCNLKWFKDWLLKRADVKTVIYCEKPDFLKGWNVTEVEDKFMLCEEPIITVSPTVMIALPGSTVHLQCNVNVLANFTWMRNGSVITDTANILQTTGGALVVRNVSHTDVTDYTCLAVTRFSVVAANAVLKVGQKPLIKGGKEEFVFVTKKNENIVLQCPTSGFPPPLTIWYFNGKLVQDGDDRFIGYDGRLILTKISSRDSGIYQCDVTNQLGMDNKIISLRYAAEEDDQCRPSCSKGYECRALNTCENAKGTISAGDNTNKSNGNSGDGDDVSDSSSGDIEGDTEGDNDDDSEDSYNEGNLPSRDFQDVKRKYRSFVVTPSPRIFYTTTKEKIRSS